MGCLMLKVGRINTGGSDSKESACNAGDLRSIPASRRSPGEGNDYPLQYCIVVWRIPWTEEPYRPQSIVSQEVRYD